MGFTINPYDRWIANKEINGHQCTIVWYVDDVKVSHHDENTVKDIIKKIEENFGEMDPVYGKEHEYLGMKIKITDDFSIDLAKWFFYTYHIWRTKGWLI